MYGYIYKFTNKVNNKYYIGKHKYSKEKLDPYYWGSGVLWENVISKYGKENIEREVIQYCNSLDELNESEQFWIDKLDATNKDIAYNIAPGGGGGSSKGVHLGSTPWNKNLSKETNNIVAESASKHSKTLRQNNTFAGENNNMYKKGYKVSGSKNGRAKKVKCIELDKIWNSAIDASEEVGMAVRNIRHCCNGIWKTAGGYHWVWVN